MSGTMLAGLLAAVLNGPEAQTHPYVVRIDHTSIQFVEGEPEPDAQLLCRVEVVSSADGSFDARTQFGRETMEISGVIADAKDGKLRGELDYAYMEEVEINSPPEVLVIQTAVELSPDESVVLGGLESRTTETVSHVARPVSGSTR